MKQMMGGDNAHFMEGYMKALETMNKEAMEYIRGIPIVKVFQQTVYSFKNFHAAIEEYENFVGLPVLQSVYNGLHDNDEPCHVRK